jgi:hypothetical protein
MKKLIMLFALIVATTVYAGESNWPMGSADGSWAMGSAEKGWPMGAAEAAKGAREIAISNHRIEIGFTQDEVLRALGSPTKTSRTVTANLVDDFWYYEVGNRLLISVMFENGRVAAFSD